MPPVQGGGDGPGVITLDERSLMRWVRSAPADEVRGLLDRAELQYLDRTRPAWQEAPGEKVGATAYGTAYHLLSRRRKPAGHWCHTLRCDSLTDAAETMSQEEARMKLLRPCRRCLKARREDPAFLVPLQAREGAAPDA